MKRDRPSVELSSAGPPSMVSSNSSSYSLVAEQAVGLGWSYLKRFGRISRGSCRSRSLRCRLRQLDPIERGECDLREGLS